MGSAPLACTLKIYKKIIIIMMIKHVNDTYDAVYNTALSARHRAVLKELFIDNTIKKLSL